MTEIKDVIIVGSGPAGLTAAVYTARANLQPLMIEGVTRGGQLMLTTDVENFPGFPKGIMGPQLMQDMRDQAERFGTEFITDNATAFEKEGDHYVVHVGEDSYKAKSIIISTGASARWLNIPSEKQYMGKGVSTCATCDGAFYKDKEIAIVGGGDSACEEALFLTKFATKVTMLVRSEKMRASKIMQDRVQAHNKIDIKWNSAIEEVLGDGKKVTGVKLKDPEGNIVDENFALDGIFLAIGHIPNTDMFKGKIDLDDKNYIKTNRFMHTNMKGVFACGDVQDTVYKQAITAAGSGCQAAMEAERYLESLH